MSFRRIIWLISFQFGAHCVIGQVSVQVLDPVLDPGEATTVTIEVVDAVSDCSVSIYGVHTESLVHFRDTIVQIPEDWSDNLPFIITLPVRALPNVTVVWGQFLIVAEIVRTEQVPSIVALAPGLPCSGNVPVGHLTSELLFSWKATGIFSQFEVVFYSNPCGKEPPPTPPATPTPPSPITPTPEPSGPVTGPVTGPNPPSPPPSDPEQALPADDGDIDIEDLEGPLPILPPGWTWGLNGAYWTGEHPPEPPDLPPGWEWGPLYPIWNGIGQPSSASIITTSALVYATNDQPGSSVVYTLPIDISDFLQPGEAFVYQVYGIAESSDGSSTGVLSQTMCDRFSPANPVTGSPTESAPCTKEPVCQLTHKLLKEPAMNGGLKPDYKVSELKIKRDDFLPLAAEGKDYDQLEWTCLPSDDCPETKSKKTIPLTSRVKFSWAIILQATGNEGNFVQLGCLPDIKSEEGEHVIFQPPYLPLPRIAQDTQKITEILLKIIDDNPTQPEDDTIRRDIRIITKRKKGDSNEDYYFITVTSTTYTLPAAPKEKLETGTCKTGGPDWERPDDLVRPSEKKPAVPDNDNMVVGQWMRMHAEDQRDNDLVKIRCDSEKCEDSRYENNFEDNVHWTWKIITPSGGKFVTGPKSQNRSATITDRYVIYEAPLKIADKKPYLDVKITLEVFNPEKLKRVDNKPPVDTVTLRIYKAGIEIERTPVTWLPEKDNFVDLESKLKYYDGQNWQDALAHMCRIHFFELNDVTTEKGYCTNAPKSKEAKKCFDLRLKNDSALEHEAFTKSKKPGKPTDKECKNYKDYLVEARTKKPERTYTIRAHSEDYGGFGTLLSHANINIYDPKKQKEEEPVYISIPDTIQDHPDRRKKKTIYQDNRVAIPRDIDENHIADNGWTATVGSGRQQDPSDVKVDTDDLPAGDGYRSDGYTGYEEYRGFDIVEPRAGHVRTDMRKKDLMVWNEGAFDVSRFRDASELAVHVVDDDNLFKSSGDIYMANFNSPTFAEHAQAGLRLCNGASRNCSGDDKALGIVVTVTKHPAPPNWVYRVVVYRNRIENLKLVEDGFITYDDKAQHVVAHELGHAVNAYHHGERLGSDDNPDYNNKHGVRSGNVYCIMRYDNLEVLACQNLPETEITVRGRRRKARVEPTGTIFCIDSAGTGYNARDQCFGNCAAGRGDCNHQFRVSGRDAKYPKR